MKRKPLPPHHPAAVQVAKIVIVCAWAFDCTPDEILSRRRPEMLCRARHAVYLLTEDVAVSANRIGDLIQRDHGSVLMGRVAARNRLETEPSWAEKYNKAKEMLATV